VKQLLVLVLTVLATLSPVRANLGDRDERIDEAYGNVVERHLLDDGRVSILYHKDQGPYLYFVIFANGRSVLEGYSRVKGTDLSEKEIARFLKANAAGGTWVPAGTPQERRFKRSDDKAEATYATTDGRPTLTVRTKEGRTRSGQSSVIGEQGEELRVESRAWGSPVLHPHSRDYATASKTA
jgi:hypothetical protein